jgi:hypothetical protein
MITDCLSGIPIFDALTGKISGLPFSIFQKIPVSELSRNSLSILYHAGAHSNPSGESVENIEQ